MILPTSKILNKYKKLLCHKLSGPVCGYKIIITIKYEVYFSGENEF